MLYLRIVCFRTHSRVEDGGNDSKNIDEDAAEDATDGDDEEDIEPREDEPALTVLDTQEEMMKEASSTDAP